jgi:hypothetical protein
MKGPLYARNNQYLFLHLRDVLSVCLPIKYEVSSSKATTVVKVDQIVESRSLGKILEKIHRYQLCQSELYLGDMLTLIYFQVNGLTCDQSTIRNTHCTYLQCVRI